MRTVTTENLYLEGEEKFGPVTSFLFGLSSIVLNKYYDAIVEDLKGKKFSSLLDLGCGRGNLLIKLAGELQTPSFYGLDPSPYMLKSAQKNLTKKELTSRLKVKIGSSRVIPFEEKFDAIISSFSYHHWKDRDSSIASIASHLSDDGFISIYEHEAGRDRISKAHGIKESDWEHLEIEGLKKTVTHNNGLIILTLTR